ncbi:DUF1624 domain-containing protein [Pseudohoeflea coraliihabitans]|uniref:DUF1624 domain-containing protein n=1 Tax=Pseudohoeflea coraliihabitans TaxID=2860393 RepID=A0ABS6WTX5_9HYPH|nr:heparan-alpha-glucosaminide N-acetyltransferase [Pseudohoeflea sp. DP4N28-3]MBW3098519.1 DUF1624 domain-containing protein [Pseudohoeflea sp. DP4N28-3]
MSVSEASGGEVRPAKRRLEVIDLARGLALLAMASYHLIWDFEMFGYLAPGTAGSGWPKIYARGIAGSFLFLVGFSLVLSHWPRLRRRKFLLRLLVITAAAALVSLGTYFAYPDVFIFYGILHAIAVASVAALPFVFLPPALTLLAGLAALALPHFVAFPVLDPAWLAWIGLSERLPRALDFVPFFPWIAPVLFGVAAARWAEASGMLARLADRPPSPAEPGVLRKTLSFISRHSLAFYLVHQPILIALVWLISQAAPPDPVRSYLDSCQRGCEAQQSAGMCRRFCACTAEGLVAGDRLSALQSGRIDAADPGIAELVRQCSAKALEDE